MEAGFTTNKKSDRVHNSHIYIDEDTKRQFYDILDRVKIGL